MSNMFPLLKCKHPASVLNETPQITIGYQSKSIAIKKSPNSEKNFSPFFAKQASL
ncbi:hypothetical protein T11_18634 [Trichinella zimbabwensis]|uniref:Uncharacterized protein n=1 Tax=Trichinella zimbabwensis TaxID=268475 RepID=A0A0V1GHV7_9BILA|nr:hypothetical protein T11_18634 [Trichinella zimbabwensis]